MMPYPTIRLTGTAMPERRPLGIDDPLVLVMPVQFPFPLRWVRAGHTFPSCLKMFCNPLTTAALAVPAAARCCLLLLLLLSVLLVVTSALLFAIHPSCLCCQCRLMSVSIAWLRAWIILGYIRRVLNYTECFSCIRSSFVSCMSKLRIIWSNNICFFYFVLFSSLLLSLPLLFATNRYCT